MVEAHVAVGVQPFQRRGTEAERRRAAQHAVLELALLVVKQCMQQRAPVTEAAKDGALADAGLAGDGVHRQRLGSDLLNHAPGGIEYALMVALRVGAQASSPLAVQRARPVGERRRRDRELPRAWGQRG